MDSLPPFLGQLAIGGVALPALAALILWFLHNVGVSEEYDLIVKFVLAVVLAILVVTMHFFPQFDQVVVGVIAFIYQALMAYHSIAERATVTTVSATRRLLAR